MKTSIFYSHGKLLLTGEYVVLDEAKALAVPTKYGQYLAIRSNNEHNIIWKSYDADGTLWFETMLSLENDTIIPVSTPSDDITITLVNLLNTAKKLNPEFLNPTQGYTITTRLTFPRYFGLGSSSTLIANIAKWAKINPYTLLQQAFSGSGYDIACANSNSALVYQLIDKSPTINSVSFSPIFKDDIYFIYLNQKQNSREGIQRYKELNIVTKTTVIEQINKLTNSFINSISLSEFNTLIDQHETLISSIIQLPTIKEQLFSDYKVGSIKSLGAWGGDFIMVTINNKEDLAYFSNRGYTTIIGYDDMVL